MTLRGLAAALALCLLACSSAKASTESTVRYSLRALGTLGGTVSAAADVNALGQVVGFSMTEDGYLHAFLWQRGKMTDLGTLGGEASYATAVNDAGWVVGYSQVAGSHNAHAFLWRKGHGMRDLGTLGGAQSFASDLNDLGLVVGRAFDASDAPHGFVWTPSGGMRELAGDPFSTATAAGAGADGPIAGSAGLPFVPGLWREPVAPFAPFALPGGFDQGEVSAINARGDTVGTARTEDGFVRGFFRTAGGRLVELAPPDSLAASEAAGVSNSLEIVGTAYDDPFGISTAWVASRPGRGARPLATLVPGSRSSFAYATSVNDLGQIVGNALRDGVRLAYLITPDRRLQAARLRAFALGGQAFHRRVSRVLSGALADVARGRRLRACSALRGLQSAAARERTLSAAARPIFAADVRGFARGLAC